MFHYNTCNVRNEVVTKISHDNTERLIKMSKRNNCCISRFCYFFYMKCIRREIIGCDKILTHVPICLYQKATTVTGSNTKNCAVQQHTSTGYARTQYIRSAKHDQQNKAKHGIHKGFKQRKWPLTSPITAPFDFLLVLHCNRVCILYWFHDVVT